MNGETPHIFQQEALYVPDPGPREPLCEVVRRALELYLAELDGLTPPPLHQLVMAEVERPLLATVLTHVAGNQSQAARYLGINRTTLRKKLLHHGLVNNDYRDAIALHANLDNHRRNDE